MPYVVIENFAGGVDDRKSPVTAPPGTLLYGNNIHLTAGGEIEKRKAFVPCYAFPPDARVIGLGAGALGKLFMFGDGPRPADLYTDFEWVNVSISGKQATRVVRAQWWSGEPFALIAYSDGQRHLWRGTTRADLSTTWTIALDRFVLNDIVVLDSKTYGVQQSFLAFSGLATPESFKPPGEDPAVIGGGFIDISQRAPRAFDMRALGLYQNRVAAFSLRAAAIFGVDPDPDLNQLLQYIEGFGCIAHKSIVALGEADTLFLSYSGLRSMRARDSSNIATIADVGSPINKTLVAHLRANLDTDGSVPAVGMYEPVDGRYWLALGDVIYVLSYFPSSKVTAWTTYTPGFTVRDMVAVNDTVFVLSGDLLYSYGRYFIEDRNIGALAATDFDTSTPEAILPYVDAGQPATRKRWTGVDVGITGLWRVQAGMNISLPDHYEDLARFSKASFDSAHCGVSGESSHLKLRLTGEGDGPALLSNAVVHYETLEAA